MYATEAVEVSDSRAFILPQKDLLGRTRLFEALAPYREKYNWWGYHLLCHFIVIVQRQLMKESVVAAVPIPWNAIKKTLPSMTYEDIHALEEDGLLSRDYFSPAEHKCYLYYVASVLYDLLMESYEMLSLRDILFQGCCNLLTGTTLRPLRSSLLYQEPTLTKKAFKFIRKNCVNVTALQVAFDQLKADIATCPNPSLQQKLSHRFLSNMLCFDALVRQGLTLDAQGIGTYRPAYRPSKTGRMYEIGGAAQCFSRDFKRAAYSLPGIYNYDLRSSQLMGLLEVWSQYSDVERDVVMIEYVGNKQSKFRYAEQAGMPVDLWKECLLSLFFGASLQKNLHGSLFTEITKWATDNNLMTDPDIVFKKFIEVAQPFIDMREQWFEIIKDSICENKKVLLNAVGKKLLIPSRISRQFQRECSAFLLQGLESAFIYHLIVLSSDFGFEVRSCEHDGVITYGKIPEQAIIQVRALTGFTSAILELKDF